jgi:hypothetical protein
MDPGISNHMSPRNLGLAIWANFGTAISVLEDFQEVEKM